MGELVDTNAPYLADQLPPIGIQVQRITQSGDDLEMLAAAIQEALVRSDLVLTTGGLGPTDDDLTREAIALTTGETIYIDPASLETLKETFRRRGAEMVNANIKQAGLIPSAQSIRNAVGTAPGWWVEKGGKTIVAMPGPPAELHRMWEEQVLPRLKLLAPPGVIVTRVFKTLGLGESAINEKIAHLFHLPNATLGMYAQAGGVQVRARAKAATTEQANNVLDPVELEIREHLGDHIWGVDGDVLEEQVARQLREQHLTLATMESVTGGLLAHTITQASGSSDYFKGGMVAYSNEMKAQWGVDPGLIRELGAVSPEVAEAMARAARERTGADLGIGTTGVAGPDELEGHPPGTVHIGLAHAGGSLSFSRRLPAQRALVKQRTAAQALMELWTFLKQQAAKGG